MEEAGILGELGGPLWILVVNLVIWSGLFVYLVFLGRKISAVERQVRSAQTSETEETS